ncbi:DegT/DnrJ/EryC1/StrS family aminotransferase, partial [Amycolatopsis lurida]
ELADVEGLRTPHVTEETLAAWYGYPIIYSGDELGGLPIEKFFEALQAEGLADVDRPGSTCPLNLLPLFQDPRPLFPHHPYVEQISYRPGQFPVAERLHASTLKLPVWHRERDISLAQKYAAGFRKVVGLHHELKGQA